MTKQKGEAGEGVKVGAQGTCSLPTSEKEEEHRRGEKGFIVEDCTCRGMTWTQENSIRKKVSS